MAKKPKSLDAYAHDGGRKNIPTAELQSIAEMAEEANPMPPVSYPRETPLAQGERRERNEDLDPQLIWKGAKIRITEAQQKQLAETGELTLGDAQLVWTGKDTQDWSDLVVNVPPIYVQEKIHPRVLIDELKRMSDKDEALGAPMVDLFADFNGIDLEARTEFYAHDVHWTNRMILGDSLQVMASLAEREALRGKVQCIYFDPPYGISFNSNWQVSTRDRAVKDGRLESLTREPEQVKAFRDTWKDGIHSYLTYLRDRLTVARDLLTESGSIFVQISDENVHRVRALLDEVFGEENFIAQINFKATSPLGQKGLAKVYDYIIWYSKSKPRVKIRNLFDTRDISDDREWRFNDSWENSDGYEKLNEEEFRKLKDLNGIFRRYKLTSSGYTPTCTFDFDLYGHNCSPHGRKSWVTNTDGIRRLTKANRLFRLGKSPYFKTYFRESRLTKYNNSWTDQPAAETRVYVVQTAEKFVQRCMLMTTDPGDIVFDPTCGSGTTAYVAEQWGRKWITTDTSRVALALARTRLMSARYPSYILADSEEGIRKEAELSGKVGVSSARPRGDLRQGFVYERVPNISLGDIARNIEIDVIFDRYQKDLEELRSKYNSTLGTDFFEWEIPRDAVQSWPEEALAAHENWWKLRLARQAEIDKSIAQKADDELLYDRPYEDKSKVRVAGPFTVESLSPHRVVAMDDRDDILDPTLADEGQLKRSSVAPETDFAQVILENLRTHGVQQGAKEDRLEFTHLAAWPGELIAAEGHFNEGDKTRRAGILLGPEYGALTRTDITAAAREASDARFDVLIAVGFAFDAHTTGLNRLGPMNIIKAKMNPDLHMADDLKNTGKGNLFMVIGEPDIDIVELADGQLQIKLHGMDVFVPATGEIRSGEKDDIAAWFIDTAYNEESFFVRHAYFLGGNDPYKSLKTSLKAEINKEAWESLKRDTSRPFKRPETGRIAVKVINHFGDEVMKVFTV
ncbi:MAG: site-specific DNA-methyltransferase [Hellea sp.]